MPHYMLDMDTSSYIMKSSNDSVLKRLKKTPVSDVCISVISKSELLFGVEMSPRKQQDEAALAGLCEVLDFPDQASVDYANIRSDLKRRGTMIDANDLFIAPHVRCLGLTLVTNNTREFGQVSHLTMENWTVAR